MFDANRICDKINELNTEHEDLLKQKETLIETNGEALREKFDLECKKYLEENKEKFIREVIGEDLDAIDKQITQNRTIFDVLKSFEIEETEEVPAEPVSEEGETIVTEEQY